MAYKIAYAPEFKAMLDEAFGFLDAADPSEKASRRLFAELKKVKGFLAAFPSMYAIREDESRELGYAVRTARVGNYLLYYVVLDEDEEVVLYALRHQLTDPDAVAWHPLGEN